MADPPGPSADDVAYLAGLVRELDRPRYFATLFAPERLRADLFALYGFAAEVARIPDLVKDATLGRIRLQWWRDSLEAALEREGGSAGDTPAIRAIVSVVRRHALPLPLLKAMIDARSADLYSDPPPTLADTEELIGKTQSSLFTMAAAIAGAAAPQVAEAARHAGLAYGLARRLSALAADRARGRTILPENLLAMEGLEPSDVFVPQPKDGLQRIAAALGSLSRHHLRAAREGILPREARIVFLPLAVVEPLLSRIDQLDAEILERGVALSDLEMLARIGWARLHGI